MNLPLHSLLDAVPSPIRNIHFSASGGLFSTSTTEGWVVYRTNPLQLISRREFPDASLKIVLPLYSSNILFLVGGPPSPLYPPNKVVVWDDKQAKVVAELEFREDVRGLLARKDRLVVVLRKRVITYGIGRGATGLWREGVYATGENPLGLAALATEEGSTLLAFPGLQPGQVQLVRLPPLDSTIAPLPPPPSHNPAAAPFPSVTVILAHTTHLSALSTNAAGSILATASTKGTLVRIWEVERGFRCIRELRRGLDEARIFGVSCSADGQKIAVTSDKGTVHIWDLRLPAGDRRKEETAESSKKSQLKILQPYLPKYFSSEWSHAQFRLPPPAAIASRLPFSLSNATTSTGGERASTPTLEDDVCVSTWIEVEIPVGGSREEEAGKGKGTARRGESLGGNDRSVPPRTRMGSQIVAMTQSGGWYRISLAAENVSGGVKGESTKSASFGLGKDSATDCSLVEHRKFGAKDGW